MPPARRSSIGPYQVVRELGRGGMGVVYEVTQPGLERRLALKLVLGRPEGQVLARFRREAELLARVQHPGVVAVRGFGETPEGPYLVTDFVEGEPLDRRIERAPLSPKEAGRLLSTLADAVERVHQEGVLHRDLKPANVVVRPDGSPVLLDFGLAASRSAQRLTQTGVMVGTPAYMPPEQASGEGWARHDPRADVYGLGAVLFHAVLGRPPYTADGEFQLVRRVIMDEPDWPQPGEVARLHPGCDERSFVAVLRTAMARTPDERYPSAASLRDDLALLARGQRPGVASAEPSRRGQLALVAVGLLLAAAVGIAWRARASGEVAPVATATATTDAPPPKRPDVRRLAGARAKVGALRDLKQTATAPIADPRAPGQRGVLQRRQTAAASLREQAGEWLRETAGLGEHLASETKAVEELLAAGRRGAPLGELLQPGGQPWAVVLPGAPARLLTVGEAQPRVWSAEGADPADVPWRAPGAILDVAASVDGAFALLVVQSKYEVVRLELRAPFAARDLPLLPGLGSTRWPQSIALAPDGVALVGTGVDEVGTEPGTVVAMSAATGAPLGEPHVVAGPVFDVACAGDLVLVASGRSVQVATGIASNQVDALRFDEARGWTRVTFDPGETGAGNERGALVCFGTPTILAVSPDGARLAIGTTGRHIMVASLEDGRPRLLRYVGDAEVTRAGFNGVPSETPLAHHGGLRGLAFVPGGRIVSCAAGEDAAVLTQAELGWWDPARPGDGALLRKVRGLPRAPWRVTLAPDEASVLVGAEPLGGGDSAVERWALE